jgi:hypothetical protein
MALKCRNAELEVGVLGAKEKYERIGDKYNLSSAA